MKIIPSPMTVKLAKATFFAHALKPDIFFKNSYKKGCDCFSNYKLNEAALHFSDWLKDNEVADTIAKNGPEHALKDLMLEPLSALFAATKVDSASKHILQILPINLGAVVSPVVIKANALHIAARFGQSHHASIYEKMMLKLKTNAQEGLLLAINGQGETPLDLALRTGNTEFLRLSGSIFNKPNPEELEHKNKPN